MSKCWKFRNEAGRCALTIYGYIEAVPFWGDEITPQTFKEELEACSGPLDVFINSGGGDAFAGHAIYNILKRYEGETTVYIDGLAASIASVIAMAGDRIIMPANALMMIHDAWGGTTGNAGVHRKLADSLDTLDATIAQVYADRSGGETQTFADWMDAETWFTAAEALEAGLVDEVEENKRVAACLRGDVAVINGQDVDVRRYAHAEKLKDMAAEGTDNGGEGQPVQDNDTALEAQRSRFRAMKRRILDTTT
jgi:ATP-dependent Clp protease protease subunit